jgi:hypothetical protein
LNERSKRRPLDFLRRNFFVEPFDDAPGMRKSALFTSSSLKGIGNLEGPPAIDFFGCDAALPASGVAETRGEIF